MLEDLLETVSRYPLVTRYSTLYRIKQTRQCRVVWRSSIEAILRLWLRDSVNGDAPSSLNTPGGGQCWCRAGTAFRFHVGCYSIGGNWKVSCVPKSALCQGFPLIFDPILMRSLVGATLPPYGQAKSRMWLTMAVSVHI